MSTLAPAQSSSNALVVAALVGVLLLLMGGLVGYLLMLR